MENVPKTILQARERRRYRRYIVQGSVVVQTSSTETVGELLNVGWAGVLIRSKIIYQEGVELSLSFQVNGYPEKTTALGQVVGTQPDLMAVKFLKRPEGMDFMVSWLEQEHYPWTASS